MNTPSSKSLLTPSDIAERAGVSRAAVSNWRKRHPDFPGSAGDDLKPLFEEQEVRQWLQQHGHQYKEGSRSTEFVWSMDTLRGRVEPDRIVQIMLETLRAIKQGAAELPKDVTVGLSREALAPVWDAAAALPDNQHGHAADEILQRFGKSRGYADVGYNAVSSRLTQLLSAAPEPKPGAAIYDPACGVGAVLVSIGRRGTGHSRLIGHEIKRELAEVAMHRAELYDLSLDIQVADSLADSPDMELRADLIVAEPPFGLKVELGDTCLTDPRFEFGVPGRSQVDLAWLQHCIYHLAENGRAYVALPIGSTIRSGRDQRIRAELLRRGCVESVVGLPPGMAPNTSVKTVLWVLRRPHEGISSPVLMIDASGEEHPEQEVYSWLHDPDSLERVPHARVQVTDLLAANAQLNPERWVTHTEVDPETAVAELTEAWSKFACTVDQARELEPQGQSPVISGGGRLVTVHALVQQRVLELEVGRVSAREKHPGTVNAREIQLGRVPAVKATDAPSLTSPTEPGDVLVSTTARLHAVVDECGGHVLGAGVLRLRVLNPNVLMPEYLAACVAGPWNARFLQGVSTPRLSASETKQFEIPLRPLEAQQGVVEHLRQIKLARQRAQEVADAAEVANNALISLARHSMGRVNIEGTHD